MNAKQLLVAGLVLALSSVGGYAANTTYIVNFTADFDILGGFPPTDPVLGSFTITFDPSVTTDIVGTSVVMNRINLAGGGKPYFYYRPNTLFGSQLVVCSSVSATGCKVGTGQNSYYIQIANFPNSPRLDKVAYSAPGPLFASPLLGQCQSLLSEIGRYHHSRGV